MIRRLDLVGRVLASTVLFVLMLITVVDVFGRNLLKSPLPGAGEVTEIGMVLMIFLVYPLVAGNGQHICVDLFDGFMNSIARRIQAVLANLLGASMFGALSWRLWILGNRAAAFGDTTGYLGFPISLVFWFMSVMSGLTTIVFAVQIFRAPAPVRTNDISIGMPD